jgi:acyl-CoA synthetase (AMP-forming)/AMP-acid ligase II
MSTTAPGLRTTVVRTLVDVLRSRAEERPEQVGHTFLADGEQPSARLTSRELAGAAQPRARLLPDRR